MSAPAAAPASSPLARRLGLMDVTLIVMGGIIGSGIFVSPSIVAERIQSVTGIMDAWLLGGAIALAGAFVYAELGARRPLAGGQYAYLREAFHPALAFVYAWSLLLLIQTGAMAAAAMTFARYARELGGVSVPEGLLAALVLGLLTLVNWLGVRAGAGTHNVLMVMKVVAILAVVVAGFAVAASLRGVPLPMPGGVAPLASVREPNFGTAMVPVLFAYGGWQSAAYLGGEVKDSERTLPRGMMLGVFLVVLLYVAVNFACLRVLGAPGLAATPAPAAAVMRTAFGEAGARWLALGVAASTLGLLSQNMLTAPRVYYAMASDGLFFKAVARVHPRTHVPVVAVALQGAAAIVIALTGNYGRILDTVVFTNWIFLGLSAACVFRLRAADKGVRTKANIPGHPYTTLAFIGACAWIVVQAFVDDPRNGVIRAGLLLAGWPAYLLWTRALRRRASSEAS